MFQGDPRGHQHRGGTAAQASLLNTSPVFNVNVQLCTDFFLRTSCGSPNNDCRGLPPLSLLKYGNCIIETLEPLFSHSWGGTGTQKGCFCQDLDNTPTALWWQHWVRKQTSTDSFDWNVVFSLQRDSNMPTTRMYEIDCGAQTCWQLSASSLDYGDVERGKNFNKLWRLTLLLQCPAVFQQEEGKISTLWKSELDQETPFGPSMRVRKHPVLYEATEKKQR